MKLLVTKWSFFFSLIYIYISDRKETRFSDEEFKTDDINIESAVEERSTDLAPARDIVLIPEAQDSNRTSEKAHTHDTDEAIVDETITDGKW